MVVMKRFWKKSQRIVRNASFKQWKAISWIKEREAWTDITFSGSSPYKDDHASRRKCRKVLINFCVTLLLLYHTSDWLNQENLSALHSIFLSTKPLPSLNTTVILCGKHWKIWSFLSLLTTVVIGWNVLTQKGTTFQNGVQIHFIYLLSIGW